MSAQRVSSKPLLIKTNKDPGNLADEKWIEFILDRQCYHNEYQSLCQ